MRAEILPTMWPRYRISGNERMFHYCLMTVTRSRMLYEASCHNLTPAGIENMCPSSTDKKHRDWINELMSTPGGPQDAVDQLILAAFECAVSILREAGSPVMFVINFNAYQLDLFLFKDMGICGILSKFISRMNDAEIGGYEDYSLPEPVATWYRSFYTDYMTYLDIAGRASVLAAQVASPGTQVTIQFIAMALEQAEDRARANEQTLHEPFGSVTSVDACAHLSEAVRTILLRLFKIVCTGYVDDISLIIDRASASTSVSCSVEGLLDALGVRFCKKTTKRVPFTSAFKILGADSVLTCGRLMS